MTPDETMSAMETAVSECIAETPDCMFNEEPSEAIRDLTARLVCRLSSMGLYIVSREAYDIMTKGKNSPINELVDAQLSRDVLSRPAG